MGIASYNIASSLQLVVAQRLARRLCPECKQKHTIPEKTLLKQGFTTEQLSTLTLYKANGCSNCNLGYKGRVGIYEVLPITEKFQSLIMQNANALDISKAASAMKINNLRQDGLAKVIDGITSLDEINRLTRASP